MSISTKGTSEWEGWGTSLKPAHEPIVVARKPFTETIVENVLEHGTGGINIDGCRIGTTRPPTNNDDSKFKKWKEQDGVKRSKSCIPDEETNKGRFPANLILDPVSAEMLDRQSGESKSVASVRKNRIRNDINIYGDGDGIPQCDLYSSHDDEGGASRFFYSAKAHKSERNAGLEELEKRDIPYAHYRENYDKTDSYVSKYPDGSERPMNRPKNDISTLKPINLMRYLVRLVTQPDGTVLDPFGGSGTTGCACVIEGFNYILIEKRERFAKVIAPKRIEYWSDPKHWEDLKEHSELPNLSKDEVQCAKFDEFLE